jgi:hypothetical protein
MKKKSLVFTAGSLFFAVAMFFSCQRDNITLSKTEQVQSNVVNPCETCTDFDLIKTPGNPNVADEQAGTLQVCQPSPTEITFTFTVSEDREDAWINQYGIAIDPTGENFTKLNPGFIDRTKPDEDKARQAEITIDYTTLTKDDGSGGTRPLQPGDIICVAAYANIPGPDGVGGQVWAGSIPPAKNPHPRTFCYVIKDCVTPPNPNPNCTFTQGYWFAKPGGYASGKGKTKVPSGSQWPDNLENDGISFGGFTYTYTEARAIFFGSNKKTGKTDAKQAFLQGLALKLSMYGNSQTEPCPGTLDALNAIEAYFAAKAVEQTANTINTYAPDADLRAAAGLISECLNANHCDNTPIPAGQ